MLDELLGRAELKQRIEELSAERDRLERQLEAESERRSEAVSDRQAAEERNNRLEDRIAELEGRIERLDADESDLQFRGTADLEGERLAETLDRLESFRSGPEGCLTAMVDGELPGAVEELLGEQASLVRRAEPCLVCADDEELVTVALSPPLPPASFADWGDRFRLEDDWFRPTRGLSVALVRSDLFVLGEFRDGDWTVVDAVESDVKATHSKGGFSQRRFERRRDEQIAAHLDECRAALDRHDADRLVVLGEQTVVGEFADRAERTATVDATGDPEPAFRSAVREFFTTRLYRL
jgi:peptide subunit release factor 1 (eRF1)